MNALNIEQVITSSLKSNTWAIVNGGALEFYKGAELPVSTDKKPNVVCCGFVSYSKPSDGDRCVLELRTNNTVAPLYTRRYTSQSLQEELFQLVKKKLDDEWNSLPLQQRMQLSEGLKCCVRVDQEKKEYNLMPAHAEHSKILT